MARFDRREARLYACPPEGMGPPRPFDTVASCLDAWESLPPGTHIRLAFDEVPLQAFVERIEDLCEVAAGSSPDTLLRAFHDRYEYECLNGECWAFALNAATLVPNIGLFTFAADDDCAYTHVGLTLPDGRILDSRGLYTEDEFLDFCQGHADEFPDQVALSALTADDVHRVWQRVNKYQAYTSPLDDPLWNAELRLFIEAIAIEEELDFSQPPMPTIERLLIVVHPGSLCGSADMNLDTPASQGARNAVAEDIDNHVAHGGSIALLHGFLSDELPKHPTLNNSIMKAAATARAHGQIGAHRFGCDNLEPRLEEGLDQIVRDLALDPAYTEVTLTGAWYDPVNREGCVNATQRYLQEKGFRTRVLDSAAVLTDDYEHTPSEPRIA